MKPFFSYYGAKWLTARHIGPPRHPLVIEPFAGSASYSVRWDAPRVQLYDKSADIVALWDWLIRCSSADVERIPDRFDNIDQVLALDHAPGLLVRFWCSVGRADPTKTLSPWYFQYRDAHDCRVWGAAVKRRIVTQKPSIARWTIAQASYEGIPDAEAHWHVDPPYIGSPGRAYPHSRVDYAHLAEWCRSRSGTVDVCENMGATWLPFGPLCKVVSSRGRRDGHRSAEAIWRQVS